MARLQPRLRGLPLVVVIVPLSVLFSPLATMPGTSPDRLFARLNELLVELHRSLLQYTSEAWPWSTTENESFKRTVLECAERQRRSVGLLAQFLRDRQWRIDFGMYPLEYTSLHYVAVEYLAQQLVSNQRELVEFIEAAAPGCVADYEALQLVQRIAADERAILDSLTAQKTGQESASAVWMK